MNWKAYNDTHREQRRESWRKYNQTRIKKGTKTNPLAVKNWRLKHPEHTNSYKREYRREHPEYDARLLSKRRNLGFIPLNKPFAGSEGHHIDKTHVIFVPEPIHASIWHNVWTGKNMEKINAKVFAWLNQTQLDVNTNEP